MRHPIALFALVLVPVAVLAQQEAPAASQKPAATKSSQVYKWVDNKGVVHYTDKPPNENAKPAKLPPLQTYKGGTSPSLNKFARPSGKGETPAPAGAQLQLVTPAPDETFHSPERTVPVAVTVTPDLTGGQKLIYLLDGIPQATPTPSTSFNLTEVDRGTHSVSVTLVDESGQQIGQSNAVTFHMQPPIAKQPTQPPTQGKPK